MKRILTAIAVVTLAAAMLAGCAILGENPQDPETPDASSPAAELPRGTIEGGVYTNESLELTFTAPEGWRYSTDEEIAEMLGTDGASGEYVCDMYAAGTGGSCVAVECLDLAMSGGEYIDEEQYLDVYKEETGKLGSFEFSEYADFTIGPNTFKMVTVTSADDDLAKYYYVRRVGSYMISITAILPKESDISELMANFS